MTFLAPAFGPLVLLAWLVGVRLARRAQNAVLLAASLIFYGWVSPHLALLLLGLAFTGWGMGRWVAEDPRRGRAASVLTSALVVIVLGAFKSQQFYLPVVEGLWGADGTHLGSPALRVLLPAGLSFYSFQVLGYVLDVAAGRTSGRRDLLDVLVFFTFFPQLVAGPIERANDFLVQVETPRAIRREHVVAGLGLVAWGAVQKLVVADTLAPFVDHLFGLAELPGVLVWTATLAFTVQLYADFAGYTDMARGLALLFGFTLSENFHAPYAATSPSDFWRRWHITLGRWFHDHVYSPLRGATPGLLRTLVAGWAVFLLSGLWHGVGLTFLLWGAWHATAWTVERGGRALRWPRLPRPVGLTATFCVTVVGWLLFRAPSAGQLLRYVDQAPWTGDATAWLAALWLLGLTFLLAGVLAGARWARHLPGRERWGSMWIAAGLGCALAFWNDQPLAFLYNAF